MCSQDAHNCTLEYDLGTSFFAVYDGHGGHEVATYAAQHLPQYLKNCEAYKQGDYAQALKDAFLGFDATLTTPEVLAVLKQIASNKDGGQNSGSGKTKQEYCKCCLYLKVVDTCSMTSRLLYTGTL